MRSRRAGGRSGPGMPDLRKKEKEHQEGSSGADSPFCICAGAPFWLLRHYAGNDM